jgi:hypothetical protein
MPRCEDINKCKFLQDITATLPVLAETVMEKFCNNGGMACSTRMVSEAMGRTTEQREKRVMSEGEIAFRKKVIEEGKAH